MAWITYIWSSLFLPLFPFSHFFPRFQRRQEAASMDDVYTSQGSYKLKHMHARDDLITYPSPRKRQRTEENEENENNEEEEKQHHSIFWNPWVHEQVTTFHQLKSRLQYLRRKEPDTVRSLSRTEDNGYRVVVPKMKDEGAWFQFLFRAGSSTSTTSSSDGHSVHPPTLSFLLQFDFTITTHLIRHCENWFEEWMERKETRCLGCSSVFFTDDDENETENDHENRLKGWADIQRWSLWTFAILSNIPRGSCYSYNVASLLRELFQLCHRYLVYYQHYQQQKEDGEDEEDEKLDRIYRGILLIWAITGVYFGQGGEGVVGKEDMYWPDSDQDEGEEEEEEEGG